MPSTDVDDKSLLAHRDAILGVAKDSIESGLTQGEASRPEVCEYPALLRQPAATFVTLQRNGELRGCIGTLEAHQPLIVDVAEHAFAAAFRDSRFPPLAADELDGLQVEVSVLTPAQAIDFSSETDLLTKMVPGEDGIILDSAGHRATFLPQVWEQLPDPARFLTQLKRKAGLPDQGLPEDLRVYRYHSLKVA